MDKGQHQSKKRDALTRINSEALKQVQTPAVPDPAYSDGKILLQPAEGGVYEFPPVGSVDELVENWELMKRILETIKEHCGPLGKIEGRQMSEVRAFYKANPLGRQLDDLKEEEFRKQYGQLSWKDAKEKAKGLGKEQRQAKKRTAPARSNSRTPKRIQTPTAPDTAFHSEKGNE